MVEAQRGASAGCARHHAPQLGVVMRPPAPLLAAQAPGVDPARLTESLAESLCLRAAIKPATFPFKLWAAWKLTLALKSSRLSRGGGERRGGGRAK